MLIISNEVYDKTDFPLLSDKFIEFCVVFVVNCRKLAFNFFFTATEIVTHFIKAGVENHAALLIQSCVISTPALIKCVTISVAVKKKLKASFLQLTTNTTQNSINLSDSKGKSVLSYTSFDMINI